MMRRNCFDGFDRPQKFIEGRVKHLTTGRIIDRDYDIYPLHGQKIRRFKNHYVLNSHAVYKDNKWFYAIDHEYSCRKGGIMPKYIKMRQMSKGISPFNKKPVKVKKLPRHTRVKNPQEPKIITRQTSPGMKKYYPELRMTVIFTMPEKISRFEKRYNL